MVESRRNKRFSFFNARFRTSGCHISFLSLSFLRFLPAGVNSSTAFAVWTESCSATQKPRHVKCMAAIRKINVDTYSLLNSLFPTYICLTIHSLSYLLSFSKCLNCTVVFIYNQFQTAVIRYLADILAIF